MLRPVDGRPTAAGSEARHGLARPLCLLRRRLGGPEEPAVPAPGVRGGGPRRGRPRPRRGPRRPARPGSRSWPIRSASATASGSSAGSTTPTCPALYAGALCLAYPSEYEGFGLQVCEAMAVGCPVLAAQGDEPARSRRRRGRDVRARRPGRARRPAPPGRPTTRIPRRPGPRGPGPVGRLLLADDRRGDGRVYRELVDDTPTEPPVRVRRSLLNFGTNALLMAVTMAVALPAAPLAAALARASRSSAASGSSTRRSAA